MDDDRDRDLHGDAPSNDEPQDGGSQGEIPSHENGDMVATSNSGDGDGSISLRGVFLGNLSAGFRTEEVVEIFTKPIAPRDYPEGTYRPIPVDRVDLKRGYCFVFLKNVPDMAEKDRVERFVSDINGMVVPNVSSALRAEFARGDGKVKRKEDERRRNISPSETLFVVNFHEETTKKGDLEMLFGPFGELVRIDMKGNYAFVQFRTIDEAMRAKEATNGGKLDRSVLTVEYVANRRSASAGLGGVGGRGGGFRGGGDRDRGRYDDRRGPPRGGAPASRYGADRYDDRGRVGGDRYDRGGRADRDEPRYRDRSPPGGYRRRSRSRSYSPPPRYRSRSPPRGISRHDDRDRGGRYDDRGGRYDDKRPISPGRYEDRGRYDDRRAPSPRGDRDRGYRP